MGGLTVLLSLVLLSMHRVFIVSRQPEIVPQGWAALPFMVLLALGLAVLIGLAVANRARWRAVLRPNRGRVIGALVLGLVTPFAVYSWIPWIIGGFLLAMGNLALMSPTDFFSNLFRALLSMLGALDIASLLWYPAACLIVSGIHGRILRVALFALMFWSAYSAVLLLFGTRASDLF